MKLQHLLFLLIIVGCARGKMGLISQPIDRSKVSKSTAIYISPVTTNDIQFTGDKAEDQVRIAEEKRTITSEYHRKIISQLKNFGYNAQSGTGQESGLVLKGNVRRFEHGSGAARFWVGMGAGASNMFTDFILIDNTNKDVIAKFEVIATSGGRGGLSAVGSFMDAHLIDGAEKCAEYIANKK